MKKLIVILSIASTSIFGSSCKKEALTTTQTVTYDCSTCCGGMDITYKDATGKIQSASTIDKTWSVSLQVEATDGTPKYIYCTAKPKKTTSAIRIQYSCPGTAGSFTEAVGFAQIGQ